MGRHEDEYVHRFSVEGASAASAAFGAQGGAASNAAARLQKWQHTLGMVEPYLRRAGDAMMKFSVDNVAAFRYAQDVDQQLESLYAKQGYGTEAVAATKRLATELQYLGGVNDEATKKAAVLMASFQMTPEEMHALLPHMASQAWMTEDSLESVAMAVGKAFGSGQFGQLTRYGLTLDALAKKEIQRAQAMQASDDASERAQGRAIAFDIIMQALTSNTADISDRMNTAAGQADRLKYTWGDLQEKMGAGVSDMQTWGANFLFNIIKPLSQGNDEMLKFLGATVYVGGGLVKGAGSVAGWVRNVMQYRATMALARVAKENMTKATVGDIAAENRKIGVAGREAAALKKVGAEATTTGGILSRMTGGLGFKQMLGITPTAGGGKVGAGALLAGKHGAGAALTSVTLMAGTAVLGWEVGKAISNWLDEETQYIERGGTWLAEHSRAGRRAKREGEWADTMLGEFKGTGKEGADIYKRMIAGEISEKEALALLRGETVGRKRKRGGRREEVGPSESDVTPTGDVLLRVPGDHVLTHQAARDWAHLR